MNPMEAEKLLGGYAAGILTEAEKSALFTAALERQELFDALADEEALRELLADPAAKAHLLALLAPRVRPFWRRPAILGLAASFFALVTTSVMLLRHPAPESLQPKAAEVPPAAMEKAKQKSTDTTAAPPQRKGAPLPERPAAGAAPVADIAIPTPFELKKKKSSAPPSPAMEVVAAAAEVAPAATTATVSASAENFAAAATQKQAADQRFHSGLAAATARPAYRVDRLAQGRLRLSVDRRHGDHLYVLLRARKDVRLVEPLAAADPLRAVFEFTLTPEEGIDLYVLPEAVADPRALPASDPAKGLRIRVK